MGFVLLAVVSAAAVPTVRHIASGWWNNPKGLAALPGNPQVHYQDGASEHARTVAGILPTAIARVEAIHVSETKRETPFGAVIILPSKVPAHYSILPPSNLSSRRKFQTLHFGFKWPTDRRDFLLLSSMARTLMVSHV